MSRRKRVDGRAVAETEAEEAPVAAPVVPLSNQMLMRAVTGPALPEMALPEVAMTQPGDAVEREAEHVARHGGPVSRSAGGSGGGALPGGVLEALATSGQPLDNRTMATMGQRFGKDFSGVRVHTGSTAAESAEQVSAAAYTVGSDIVFGAGRYSPGTESGEHLLAHELTHVVQGGGGMKSFHLPHGLDPRHQANETSQIAGKYADLLKTLKSIIAAAVSYGTQVDMDKFVKLCGGQPAATAAGLDSTGPQPFMLQPRYLLTRRAGLLDMRHFIQLMYIANFMAAALPGGTDGNRPATNKGREHELTSESESRFGPEDTTSNAIGAFTGSRLAALPQSGDLYNMIESMIARCDPVDFSALSGPSQDAVLHFYGDLVADGAGAMVPAHQNQQAAPEILDIPEFKGFDRSFPFVVDPDDPKTIIDTDFKNGSKSIGDDDDVREFVTTQRKEVIEALPADEKVRMCKLAFEGWVSDGDLEAIMVLYKGADSGAKAKIRAAIDPAELGNLEQRTKLRVLFGQA